MPRPLVTLAGVALLTPAAAGAIHIEIAQDWDTPDGVDDAIAQFDTWNDTTWNVWVWSDEPGVRLYGLELAVTAGPNLTVSSAGTTNPTGPHAFSFESDGIVGASQIVDISVQDPSLIGLGYVLPTSPASAWLFYDSFTLNGGGFGGLEPFERIDAASVQLNVDGATPDVELHGVYAYPEPAPGTASGLLIAAGALGARRRR